MVLLHSFEQFQYDYKQKKILEKLAPPWLEIPTVAGNSLRQKNAITINFLLANIDH